MDKNKKKYPIEKKNSQTSTSPSLANSPSKRRRSSASSKISQFNTLNKSISPSPRRKPMKKVTFKTDFIQIVVVDSYKKYNNGDNSNMETNCRCLII